jgi:hypothetical protein
MPDSQERLLTRKYSWLAAASVVPLLIVIVVLAWFQFGTQRAQLLEELEEVASSTRRPSTTSDVMSGNRLSSASIVSDSVPVTSTTSRPAPFKTISENPLTSRDSMAGFPEPRTPTLPQPANAVARSSIAPTSIAIRLIRAPSCGSTQGRLLNETISSRAGRREHGVPRTNPDEPALRRSGRSLP